MGSEFLPVAYLVRLPSFPTLASLRALVRNRYGGALLRGRRAIPLQDSHEGRVEDRGQHRPRRVPHPSFSAPSSPSSAPRSARRTCGASSGAFARSACAASPSPLSSSSHGTSTTERACRAYVDLPDQRKDGYLRKDRAAGQLVQREVRPPGLGVLRHDRQRGEGLLPRPP